MPKVISIEDLKGLFTKPYGTDAPTKQKWNFIMRMLFLQTQLRKQRA